MKIILASKSPRRKELLSTIFNEFECIPSLKEEDMTKKLSYTKLAENLSEQKAEDVFSLTNDDRVVIGSDTMVILGKTKYGKPKNEDDAFKMLKNLSGKTHKVVTGLCVIKFENNIKQKITTNIVSKVKFCKLTDDEILDYIKSGEPMDKAGSYGIQGLGKKFISKINGDYFAIMGLPVNKIYSICKKLNIVK